MVVRARRVPGVELGAVAVLLSVYALTLAPSVTLWDSGEFLSAMHSLGVPHPPGTPLYILVGNVWGKVLAPVLGFAQSVNLLSAVATATACGLIANLVLRWTRNRAFAFAAAVTAGAMSSVWLSANETEVYSIALFVSILILWCADRASTSGQRRWLLLGAYVTGLGWAVHLTALLSVPAAIYLVAQMRNERLRPQLTTVVLAGLMFCVGASAVLFMLVRAQHDPAVNQGNPSTWSAFADVLMRRQYRPVAPWPRQAPFFLQLGNIFEYADWQVALGLAPDAPPSWLRTPFTVLFGLIGVGGCLTHRAADRRSWRVMTILFVTATVGVVVYLNQKASPSFGFGILPPSAPHEARERDYFYILAFVCWGVWVGIGAVALAGRLNPRRAWMGIAVCVLPIALNWRATNRQAEPHASEARVRGLGILRATPPRGVVLARGDNDTYPLWYLQEVEGVRRDVTVVTIPMLPATWYREELQRRHDLLSRTESVRWVGLDSASRLIRVRAAQLGRPVTEASPLATR